jgi:hypothetical protein
MAAFVEDADLPGIGSSRGGYDGECQSQRRNGNLVFHESTSSV